jgi:GxxExxY protein
MYEGVLCGKYQPDIVVENRVVLELKAVSALADEHIAQALSYLRASGLSVALLINFGSKSLTWKRFQN